MPFISHLTVGKLQFSSASRDANSSLFKAQFLDRARIVGKFFFFLYSLSFLYINKNIYVWAWLKIKFIHYSPQEYLQLYNIWLFHLNHFVWINWLKLSTVTQHFFKKNYITSDEDKNYKIILLLNNIYNLLIHCWSKQSFSPFTHHVNATQWYTVSV